MLVLKTWHSSGRRLTLKRNETFFEEIPRLLRNSGRARNLSPELARPFEIINRQISKQANPLLLNLANRRRRGHREINFDVSPKGRIIFVE